jgi:hypothetical protein
VRAVSSLILHHFRLGERHGQAMEKQECEKKTTYRAKMKDVTKNKQMQ